MDYVIVFIAGFVLATVWWVDLDTDDEVIAKEIIKEMRNDE